MNKNEKFHITYWSAEAIEDVYNEGEVGAVISYWDCKVFGYDMDKKFDSIQDALKDICETNSFDFCVDEWMHDDYYNDTFVCDILVNDENYQASKEDIKKWKSGEIKLYNCRITVRISVVTERELMDDDIVGWNKK